MRLLYLFLIGFCCLPSFAVAQVWQWRVSVSSQTSGETNAHPQAFLWIPEHCTKLNGIIFGQHNMTEEPLLEHPKLRATLAELGIGEVWVTPLIAQVFDFKGDAPADFQYMMDQLASVSGYDELRTVPVIPVGHSAQASFPWNFAAWAPSRTLALISLHGDAPLTPLTGSGKPNPDWQNRNIDGIPALFIMGEYEWWEDRITPAFNYILAHPASTITLFADAGHGHFDVSDNLVDYIALFIRKAVAFRNRPDGLRPVSPAEGWLMDRWHKDSLPLSLAAPYNAYSGNRKNASWVFDKSFAAATEHYYQLARGKQPQYIGFRQHGSMLKPDRSHAVFTAGVQLQADGVTFNVNACFTDTTRLSATSAHAITPLRLNRICGPVKKINDTTFRVDFYRMGMNNNKRSNDIWLIAENSGDKNYKSVVQQLNIKIPLPQTSGQSQEIHFEPLPDQVKGIKEWRLSASATSGLKVFYYVKEGPAYIQDNKIVFTTIPPRARFPVKVTVVAWQYGINGKYRTAMPVEQSFNINAD